MNADNTQDLIITIKPSSFINHTFVKKSYYELIEYLEYRLNNEFSKNPESLQEFNEMIVSFGIDAVDSYYGNKFNF
jgi:hypothetical protein